MPPPEGSENVKLNLDRNFFDRIEALIPDLKEDEHRRNLADLNLLTREAAFHYASGLLDQLATESSTPKRVHESLELNFRVIGRILKEENLMPSWFDSKRDGVAGFKEIMQIKRVSALYAIKSALKYRELTSEKGDLGREQALELGRLETSVSKDDIEALLKKFDAVPEIHRQDLLKNLGL